jgi:hypothetical protein
MRRRCLPALMLMFLGYLACDAGRVPDRSGPGSDPIDPRASAEDLYFEFVRLHSLGLVSEQRMQVLQNTLVDVESRSNAAEVSHATRDALASLMRRTLGELKRSDPELLDAMEAREYARRLNRTGIAISQDLSEVTLVIAGCLGVPTSKGELALVILLPAGGYLVGKIANVAIKRAIFLLRRARTVEDVVATSERIGLRFSFAPNPRELVGLIKERPADQTFLERLEAAFGPRYLEMQGAVSLGKLRPIGPDTWESAAGLVYGPDKIFGNRVQHVLAHTVPAASKSAHTMFSVPRAEVLELVDEAWKLRGASLPGNPGAFVVPMDRTVGTAGETALKIIVRPGTNQIVTAYPVVP